MWHLAGDPNPLSITIIQVETIGDAYVCIAGAPTEREDHALLMCRFASLCMKRFASLSKDLVVSLGPDTSDLELRWMIRDSWCFQLCLRGLTSLCRLCLAKSWHSLRASDNGSSSERKGAVSIQVAQARH